MPNYIQNILLIQGSYFLLTGLWAIADIESFMLVTGPKTDIWLVKTISLLLSVNGVVFLIASREKIISGSVKALSILSSIILLSADFFYHLMGVIRWVYLVDGFIQLIFIIAWFFRPRKRVQA